MPQLQRYISINTVRFAGSDAPQVCTFRLQGPLHSVGGILAVAHMQHLESGFCIKEMKCTLRYLSIDQT